jgi:hypothetical protein
MNKHNLISLILYTSILAAIFGVLMLQGHLEHRAKKNALPSPSPTTTQARAETATPTLPTATHAAAASPTPENLWQVCTGIPNGHLHVREKPGHQAPILGVLTESTSITPTGQRDSDWLEISAPLAGWVNSKFLCEVPQP